MARGRIRDFWGGVYKRFLVLGPQTLTVQVSRNYSFNTILAGVFLDKVGEEPEPYFSPQTPTLAESRRERRALAAQIKLENQASGVRSEAQTVDAIWRELERIEAQNPRWHATEGRAVYTRLLPWLDAARLRTTDDGIPEIYRRIGSCYYQLAMFESWETFQERRGLTTARTIEKGLVWDGKNSSSGQGRAAIIGARMEREKNARPADKPKAAQTVTAAK